MGTPANVSLLPRRNTIFPQRPLSVSMLSGLPTQLNELIKHTGATCVPLMDLASKSPHEYSQWLCWEYAVFFRRWCYRPWSPCSSVGWLVRWPWSQNLAYFNMRMISSSVCRFPLFIALFGLATQKSYSISSCFGDQGRSPLHKSKGLKHVWIAEILCQWTK